MKYIVNEENTCGQATLSDEVRNLFLEAMGYPADPGKQINESVAHLDSGDEEVGEANPALYEWDQAIFALEEEVFEIEGDLFLKATELDAETRSVLDESHNDLFINSVSFDDNDFTMGDIYDYGNDIYIKLDETGKKDTGASKGDKGKDKDDPKAKDYENGGDRKGDDSKTHAGKDFGKNGNGDDDDDENGDPRAFGGKKGDKSKTHKGRDFIKKEGNGDEMSDDDIDAAMNKNAPKDAKQVALRKKLKPASKGASKAAAGAHGDA